MAHPRSSLAPLLAALLVGAVACGDDHRDDDHAADGDVPDANPDAPTDAPLDAPLEEPETAITVRPPALTNQASRFEITSSIAGSTFVCSVDDGTEAPCVSPFEPALADGRHTLAVAAVSPQGARDRTPATASWTIDTAAPATTLIVTPPALDNSVRASFQFTSEASATFACAVDGAAFAPCESPFRTAPLVDGPHTLDVRATDLAGNTESPARHHAWTLDSGTPDTVIDSGPTAPTTATDATFTFSSPDAGAGAAYTCALDDQAASACASPWTVATVADGSHTVRITVRDAAHNVDPSPATRTWRVDTTPPTVAITSGPSGPIRDATPSFDFVRSDGPYPVTTECRITGSGATAFAPCAQHYTAATIPDGDATFVIVARDAVGLETTVERAFTVDTMAPVITVTAAPPSVITDSVASLAFTVTGATSVECRLDGGTWEACDGTFQTPVLVDGPHTLDVRARDAALNETLARRSFNRDTEAPVITFTAGPDGPTANDEPVFGFRIEDRGSSVRSSCQLDQLPAVTPCHAGFQAPPLADGNHTLTVTATDEAGHVGRATRAFSIDTRNLGVTFTSVPTNTSNPRPTISFTVVGAAASLSCRADNQPWEACVSPWTVPTPLADGPHEVSVRVHDGRGSLLISNTGTFTVDTTP